MAMKIHADIWVVVLYSDVLRYQPCRGPCRLHLWDGKHSVTNLLPPASGYPSCFVTGPEF